MNYIIIDHPKYDPFLKNLKDVGKMAVAFSGRVDSSFLMAVSEIAVGDNDIYIWDISGNTILVFQIFYLNKSSTPKNSNR